MRLTCFVAAALALVAPAPAQDTIENPEFASWSKFKKGTSVTVKVTSTAAGAAPEVLATNTLVEVGADKLVIETVSVAKVAGREVRSPAVKRDVPKSIPVPPGVKKEDLTALKPPGTYEGGFENLKVGGAEYKTLWVKYRSEALGTKTEGKMWTSADVPGTVVKTEVTVTALVATATTKMEVVEIKKP